DMHGMTALHWAAKGGHAATVEEVLAHRGQVNIQDTEGNTALHYAVSGLHVDVVEALLKFNADARLLNRKQQDAAAVAAASTASAAPNSQHAGRNQQILDLLRGPGRKT